MSERVRRRQAFVVEAIQYLPGPEGCRALYDFMGWDFEDHNAGGECGPDQMVALGDAWDAPYVQPGEWVVKDPLSRKPLVMKEYPLAADDPGEVITVEEILTILEPTAEDLAAVEERFGAGYQSGFVDGLRGAQARVKEYVRG